MLALTPVERNRATSRFGIAERALDNRPFAATMRSALRGHREAVGETRA